jgi:hypothetical protein
LGVGIESAVEVTRKSNIRGGFNFFNYGLTETKDGIGYNAQLHLRSADALYDWFPFGGGFHLSGGALLYNGNSIKATASVPGGGSFTLGGIAYTSEASNPISGTAELNLGNKVAPMGLLGWGNLIPRSGRHLGVNFEIGAAFVGAPQSTLALTGGACVSSTVCLNSASDPTIQANIASEKKKVDNSVSFVKALPVISLGISYRF